MLYFINENLFGPTQPNNPWIEGIKSSPTQPIATPTAKWFWDPSVDTKSGFVADFEFSYDMDCSSKTSQSALDDKRKRQETKAEIPTGNAEPFVRHFRERIFVIFGNDSIGQIPVVNVDKHLTFFDTRTKTRPFSKNYIQLHSLC